MRCPFCAHDDSQVKDSRPTEDNTAIRRRRQCEGCGARFTTFERVQLREITVDAGKADIGHRIELAQAVHHHFADRLRWHFAFAQGFDLALDA